MSKSRIFIGSSKEGREIARAIQYQLREDAECAIWDEGVFGLGLGTMEALVHSLHTFQFAIFVLSQDDLTTSRDITQPSPRDNVLLEIGLFIGRIGRTRTFITFDKSRPVKLPSDLAGVTLATYDDPVNYDYISALGPACTRIRNEIKHPSPIEYQHNEPDPSRLESIDPNLPTVKIGISGAQSVGKTTTCHKLVSLIDRKYKAQVSSTLVSEVARGLIVHGATSDKETRQEDYARYISKHINNFFNSNSSTLAIFDRTLVDVLAYARANGNLHPYWVQLLEDLVRIMSRAFHLYYFVPIQASVPIEDDGVRETDPKYRQAIHDEIENILKAHFPKYIALTGEIDVRGNMAFQHLDTTLKDLKLGPYGGRRK